MSELYSVGCISTTYWHIIHKYELVHKFKLVKIIHYLKKTFDLVFVFQETI